MIFINLELFKLQMVPGGSLGWALS